MEFYEAKVLLPITMCQCYLSAHWKLGIQLNFLPSIFILSKMVTFSKVISVLPGKLAFQVSGVVSRYIPVPYNSWINVAQDICNAKIPLVQPKLKVALVF